VEVGRECAVAVLEPLARPAGTEFVAARSGEWLRRRERYVEECIRARPVRPHVVEEDLHVILTRVALTPMVGVATKIHRRVAGVKIYADFFTARLLHVDRPSDVLRKIECEADLAGVTIAMAFENLALLIAAGVGIRR